MKKILFISLNREELKLLSNKYPDAIRVSVEYNLIAEIEKHIVQDGDLSIMPEVFCNKNLNLEKIDVLLRMGCEVNYIKDNLEIKKLKVISFE